MQGGKSREQWLRELSCCKSRPQCGHCPLAEANQGKDLKTLMEESLNKAFDP